MFNVNKQNITFKFDNGEQGINIYFDITYNSKKILNIIINILIFNFECIILRTVLLQSRINNLQILLLIYKVFYDKM